MAYYDVYVFCNNCGDVHPMGIRIEINDIRGRLAKDLLQNRSANPQHGLLSDMFKKMR